LLLFLFFGW